MSGLCRLRISDAEAIPQSYRENPRAHVKALMVKMRALDELAVLRLLEHQAELKVLQLQHEARVLALTEQRLALGAILVAEEQRFGEIYGPRRYDPSRDFIGPPRPPSGAERVRRVIADVCAAHGMSRDELMGRSRHSPLVRARQEAMWRVKHETGWALTRVGRCFGRDHSTVLHGVRKHQALVDRGDT